MDTNSRETRSQTAPVRPEGGARWLFWFAGFTALATLGLVGIGGLVTSHGVGMSVPDWPTSYGYNMFALPISTWFTGGIFHEHTHRLWASWVGVLVVALTRWLGGAKSRRPLMIIGAAEILGGLALLRLGADWKGAGHFLAGIGGVVLLGGMVWVRNAPADGWLPRLGWAAFWLVQLQGLLGGLRVVLDAHLLADVRLGVAFGIFHGCLGQVFLVLLAVIGLLTSCWWINQGNYGRAEAALGAPVRRWFGLATVLIFAQLMLGATMRHQHAGLAIPDFPLAYGKLWPDLSEAAVAGYNQRRMEVTAVNPITGFQIALQMAHRLMAVLVLAAVAVSFWKTPRGTVLKRVAGFWLGLILAQAGLGAWTVWSNKAADVATAHVLVGALSLVTGALAYLICMRRFAAATRVIPQIEPRAEAVVTGEASA
jgi:cytochrome c oxidase assembly protein subunit 15